MFGAYTIYQSLQGCELEIICKNIIFYYKRFYSGGKLPSKVNVWLQTTVYFFFPCIISDLKVVSIIYFCTYFYNECVFNLNNYEKFH